MLLLVQEIGGDIGRRSHRRHHPSDVEGEVHHQNGAQQGPIIIEAAEVAPLVRTTQFALHVFQEELRRFGRERRNHVPRQLACLRSSPVSRSQTAEAAGRLRTHQLRHHYDSFSPPCQPGICRIRTNPLTKPGKAGKVKPFLRGAAEGKTSALKRLGLSRGSLGAFLRFGRRSARQICNFGTGGTLTWINSILGQKF